DDRFKAHSASDVSEILENIYREWKPTSPEVTESAISADVAESASEAIEPEFQTSEFLDQMYALIKMKEYDEATDELFDVIDRLLSKGDFLTCNEILRQLDLEPLPTRFMRSVLTITYAAKEKLASRNNLYLRIQERMVEQKGEEMTKRLIGRLA